MIKPHSSKGDVVFSDFAEFQSIYKGIRICKYIEYGRQEPHQIKRIRVKVNCKRMRSANTI